MKLRAYLVDDEPLAIARLTRLLDDTGRVEVIGSATDPEEAVEALTSDPPDVCFLDIQMPRLNGFEVLARLPVQPIVVFTTAHERYALEAFAVNSVDYLLKPVDPRHLERALGRVERLRSCLEHSPPDLQGLLRTLADSLRVARPEYPERIASRLGDRLWFIDLAHVTHFFAEDKLTYAVEGGKSVLCGLHDRAAGKHTEPQALPSHPPQHAGQHRLDQRGHDAAGRRPQRAPERRQRHRPDGLARPGEGVQDTTAREVIMDITMVR